MFLDLYSLNIVKAIEQAGEKGIKLIWLQGQSDTGCTVSLIQGKHPDIYDAIMKLEGSIPDPKFATIGERPFIDILKELASKTKVAVVAVGTCAAYGGIPATFVSDLFPDSKLSKQEYKVQYFPY